MTTPSRHHRARRAFTLLEVIIAVTIVALLAALVVPRLTKFLAGAHEDKAVAEVNTLANQVRLYITTETTGTLNNDFTLETLLDGDDPYRWAPTVPASRRSGAAAHSARWRGRGLDEEESVQERSIRVSEAVEEYAENRIERLS